MACRPQRLTREQVAVALGELNALYPGQVQLQYENIISDVLNKTNRVLLCDPVFFNGFVTRQRTDNPYRLDMLTCTWEDKLIWLSAKVVVGVVYFAIKLLGFYPPSRDDHITGVLVAELGGQFLTMLVPIIFRFYEASNGRYRASHLAEIMKNIFVVGGFRIVLREVIYSLTRWDWLRIGMNFFIHLAPMFSTPIGYIQLFQTILTLIDATELVVDVKNIYMCYYQYYGC